MKKNILLSGILLLSFSCAIAQDYHDDVVVLDSVKVMSFNIRFNNPNDSLDTAWDRRREPCARMIAQYRPDVIGMQEPRNEMWQQIFAMLPDYGYYRIEMNDTLPDSRTGGVLLLYLREKYSVILPKFHPNRGTRLTDIIGPLCGCNSRIKKAGKNFILSPLICPIRKNRWTLRCVPGVLH